MKKEEENCLPSPVARPGEGERRTVSLKTTLFCPFFFLHETASFYTKRAASFKCGASKNFFKSVLNYLLFISIASISISSPPSYLAAFSTLVLVL
jgi:hypothetical protein